MIKQLCNPSKDLNGIYGSCDILKHFASQSVRSLVYCIRLYFIPSLKKILKLHITSPILNMSQQGGDPLNITCLIYHMSQQGDDPLNITCPIYHMSQQGGDPLHITCLMYHMSQQGGDPLHITCLIYHMSQQGDDPLHPSQTRLGPCTLYFETKINNDFHFCVFC